MALFTLRSKDFLTSAAAMNLKESPALMQELIVASSDSFDSDARFGGTARVMSVNELRKELNEKGLGVDGSKETLISRLEASRKRQREE